MRRIKVSRKLGCILGVCAFVLLILIAPIQTVRWDGGFEDREYQLTFLDEKRTPIPNITLRVQTQSGSTCYFYPVDEYFPEGTPTSDSDGRMVFHHVNHGAEYGGVDQYNLLGFCLWCESAPQYDCIFIHDKKVVHRLRFNKLPYQSELSIKSSSIIRQWSFPNWPQFRYIPPVEDKDWGSYERRLFNGDRNQKLEREQRIGSRILSHGVELASWTREIEFSVVARTITISTP
jgi:hypothetical protein